MKNVSRIKKFRIFVNAKKETFMETKQEEILSGTYEIFKKLGLRSVSMDDIAKELRVSKKTIYLYYKNKAELIADVLKLVLEQEDYMSTISKEEGNAIDHLLKVGKAAMKHMAELNPLFLFELEKYYPELCEMFFKHKTEQIYNHILQNITVGIDEKIYRSDLNAELVATLYTERIKEIRNLAENINLKKYSFADIISQLIEGHIRGIVNDEGRQYFESKIAEKNK